MLPLLLPLLPSPPSSNPLRSMDRSLTDEEINGLQEAVRQGVSEQLKVELR